MEDLKYFIAELKRLSNTDYCDSAGDLQYNLEKINNRLNEEFPNIDEDVDKDEI
jgi:hypothetical protein